MPARPPARAVCHIGKRRLGAWSPQSNESVCFCSEASPSALLNAASTTGATERCRGPDTMRAAASGRGAPIGSNRLTTVPARGIAEDSEATGGAWAPSNQMRTKLGKFSVMQRILGHKLATWESKMAWWRILFSSPGSLLSGSPRLACTTSKGSKVWFCMLSWTSTRLHVSAWRGSLLSMKHSGVRLRGESGEFMTSLPVAIVSVSPTTSLQLSKKRSFS
mmetsp:Transcript_114229/g.285764  ORF Transcript_114229/g.285764 Transcript_114229/m.285764 type:complete len:220 (-) Transcript_114229:1620-2279(-)